MRGISRKGLMILYAIAVILIISPASFSDDRWRLCAGSSSGSKFYLDTRGIIRTQVPHIVRAWVKVVYSETDRKGIAESERSKTWKKKLSKLSETKICYEIDWREKAMRSIEDNLYDSKGNLILTIPDPYSNWTNISPDSVGECICNAVLQVFYGYEDIYSY